MTIIKGRAKVPCGRASGSLGIQSHFCVLESYLFHIHLYLHVAEDDSTVFENLEIKSCREIRTEREREKIERPVYQVAFYRVGFHIH